MDICDVDGCEKPVFATGLCSTHYSRFLRTGTTDAGPRARADFATRFWSKVDVHGPDECWPWVGKSLNRGYGYIGVGGRGEGKLLSNRAAWLLRYGELPADQVVRHKCHNRLCCNPDHLQLGSLAENVADMWARPDGPKGNARLSPEQVEAIRCDPRSSRQLAPIYGVHHAHIRHIRRKRVWRDV